MKKLIKAIVSVLIAVLFFASGGREKVIEVFGHNVGFDGFSRTVEVAVTKNPAAAFVFNAERGEEVNEC